MSALRQTTCSAQHTGTHRGITIIEAVMSVLLIGVVMVAAMQAAAMSSMMQRTASSRATASFLASSLIDEILTCHYRSPTATPNFGRETGELATSKGNYDDIDDFHNWSESPPQYRNGTAMPDLNDWKREVSVTWVDPLNLHQAVSSESGCKRITVSVSRNNRVLATRIAVRTAVTP